jgi:hypothetical protein
MCRTERTYLEKEKKTIEVDHHHLSRQETGLLQLGYFELEVQNLI